MKLVASSHKSSTGHGGLKREPVRRWLKRLGPLLLFAFLTVIVAWRVVKRLDTVIIGLDQDAFINPWADMWTLRALRDPEYSLWFTDYLFYPVGVDLHFHSFSHLTTAVSLALRPLFGTLSAYNLAVLLHVVLAAVAMFHFVRYLTDSIPAALLAGLVFAFNSHNLWQTTHPVLVGIWPLPWAALFLLQAIERRDSRRALIAAIFVLLATLNSVLMLILTGLWLEFILLYALVSDRLQRSALPTVALFGITSAALAVLPLLPLLGQAFAGNSSFLIGAGHSLPTDALAPLQPYWFGLLARSLHFGIVPLVLLAASLLDLRNTWPWLLFLLVTYLFAIGPRPVVGGTELDVTLRWSHLVSPLLRQTHRLNVLMSAALAVLVAYGWTVVARRVGGRPLARWLLALLAGGLIFVEYTQPPFHYRDPAVSDFYSEYLDTVPDDVALAILPTGRQQDKLYMYYQTLHGHPMTGGVVSRPTAGDFSFIRSNPVLRAGAINWEARPLPDDVSPALQELANAGVGYLVLDKPYFAQSELDLDGWRETIAVSPIYEDDLVVVFPTEPN